MPAWTTYMMARMRNLVITPPAPKQETAPTECTGLLTDCVMLAHFRRRCISPLPTSKNVAMGGRASAAAVMEGPLKSTGCRGYTPLVHSLEPHFPTGRAAV